MVIMPSRAEGFGLTGVEALSAGLPVIVSKNSGFGEALGKITSASGFVVDLDNPSSWEAANKGIWNKRKRHDSMKLSSCVTTMERDTVDITSATVYWRR